MAHIIEDRVLEQSTTAGLGAFTLAGAMLGYRAFASVCTVADTVWYYIEAIDSLGKPSGAYEYGLGTYSGVNTLTRTTVRGSSNGGAAVNFAAGSKLVGIGPVAPSATATRKEWRSAVKVSQSVNIDAFSPTADGTTDDLTPLTNFINSAIANPGVPHFLNHATYATSAALPDITVSGVKIFGTGPSSNHDAGSINGSCIKKIGAAGGTMLTVSPVSNVANQRLDGIVIDGVAFNGNQKAAKGLLIKSVRNSFFGCYAEECTTSNFELDVVAALADAKDLQDCTFRLFARDLYSGGACLRLLGTSAANVSLNRFEIVDIVQSNQTGIICQNPDNNLWGVVRVYLQPAGTAVNSIEWQGGASALLATRCEVIEKLTCDLPAIAKGTGTYTIAAYDIMIRTLDKDNVSPAPTVETGASVCGPEISWTPTISASSGSITSSSATAKYRIDPNDPRVVDIRLSITMTNNGTGSGVLRATLPFTASNDAIAGNFSGFEGISGKGCVARVNVNTSQLLITYYDATYPGATSNVVTVTGSYRRV